MSGPPKRVFVARLVSAPVFDPLGDQVGRVRDAVIVYRATMRQFPRVIGLVVEVPGRRRVFVPMGRVTAIDSGQVITTGLVNMRRFEQRQSETLVINDLLDRRLRLREDDSPILAQTQRSEEHTSELQSRGHLVCRLLLEKKKQNDGQQRTDE